MGFSEFTTKTIDAALSQLESSLIAGLTSNKASELLKKYGPNEVKTKEVKWWQILLRQFKSSFVYLLIAAAFLSFMLGETVDAWIIVLFIVVDAILGFYQEFKSEKTLSLLKKYIVKRVKVIRDGKDQVVDSSDLVLGDIVVLETGDVLSADIRVLEENDFSVDESTLTGETIQVKKQSEPLQVLENQTYKAKNIAFAGTLVVEGKAKGLVIATGRNTEIGRITTLTVETKGLSSFEKQINQFSKFILYITVIVLFIVLAVHLLFKPGVISISDLLIFSIALAVGVIPEALPLVTTFSLAQGAKNLAKKQVVIKRLSAIEDLGSIQILCSDKTGTLTHNELSVSEINGPDKASAGFYSLLASSYFGGEKMPNNSFDIAIIKHSSDQDKAELKNTKVIFEIPFSPVRRRNSVLVSHADKQELIVRGAPEAILPYSKNLSQAEISELDVWLAKEGKSGKRTIAIAKKSFTKSIYTTKDEESDLEFVGLLSFVDPIKDSAYEAVKKAEILGVKIKILTGDGPEVAGAVAHEVGIISDPADVITGDAFDKLSSDKKMADVLKYNVFARVSPEQKFEIIKLLQNKYEVGYLGEGINDAPALKLANVGLAVNSASDVAREASDIILMKEDLKIIIEGIEEGRKTFVNTTKYIKATLASNFGNFYAMAFASVVLDFLPMLPIQILLLNMLSDFPMISITTDVVEKSELKNPRTYNVKEITIVASVLGAVSTLFDFIMFGTFYKMGAAALQTNWFIGSVLTELVLIYTIRTHKVFFLARKRPSSQIIWLTVLSAVITLVIPYSIFGQSFFGFIQPTWYHIGLLVFIVAGYFIATETVKNLYYRYFSKDHS